MAHRTSITNGAPNPTIQATDPTRYARLKTHTQPRTRIYGESSRMTVKSPTIKSLNLAESVRKKPVLSSEIERI